MEEQILTGLRWRVAFDDDDDDEATEVVVRTEGAFILVVGIVIYTSVLRKINILYPRRCLASL